MGRRHPAPAPVAEALQNRNDLIIGRIARSSARSRPEVTTSRDAQRALHRGVDVAVEGIRPRGRGGERRRLAGVDRDIEAAGPVGRHAEGETDWKMRAEVLTYSRARGVFAGLTVNGAVIEQDGDATRAFYGRETSFRDILQGGVAAPAGSEPFLAAVKKFSAKSEAAKLNERKSDGR